MNAGSSRLLGVGIAHADVFFTLADDGVKRRKCAGRAMKITVGAAVGAVAIVGLVVGGGVPAAAAQGGPPPPHYTYSLIQRVKHINHVRKSQILARCAATTSGSSCSIITTKASQRTWGLALGASKGYISGVFNYSNSTTETVGINCTSPKMKKGQVYYAWPLGSYYDYKVRRTELYGPYNDVIAVKTSGIEHSFNPYSSGVACGTH
jgi:hypothetical protein